MSFQKQILQDQRMHVLEQFQKATLKWQNVKQTMQENIMATNQSFQDRDQEVFKLAKEWDFFVNAGNPSYFCHTHKS